MTIESKTKNFPGTNSYFEQRATNKEEQKSYYFNQPVVKFTITDKNKSVIKEIIKDMHASMEGCGIGLAHNQYPQQGDATNPYAIFIIEAKDCNRYNNIPYVPFEAFINPVIVGYTTDKVGFYHGCLSALDELKAKVSTYKEVLIAFFSEDLQPQVKKYTDMAAIICQHEFNHLTTAGTYVDTVNNYVNGDRFLHADGYYLSAEAIKELHEDSQILEPVGENVPCLINEEILARCKKTLADDELYKDAVNQYLQNHPEDKQLYDNLMANLDTNLSLYEEPQQHSMEIV